MNFKNVESLFLSNEDIEAVKVSAESEYPFECCGIIIGEENSFNNRVKICKNIQNKLHKDDPEHFPRDAKTAYYIDPKEILQITKESENNGLKIKAFFHSHPDHEVYFSKEDKKNALFFDTPAYPDVTYIVVSVFDKKVKGVGFFLWDESVENFVKK